MAVNTSDKVSKLLALAHDPAATQYLIQDAFDGLLTEFGKILLVGLYTMVIL